MCGSKGITSPKRSPRRRAPWDEPLDNDIGSTDDDRPSKSNAAGGPMSARYAIYFVPAPDTALARFGASVIGYDVWTGDAAPFPELPAFKQVSTPEWSKDPSRYGFHATLKAPFHLRQGRSEAELHALVRSFAEK